MPVTMRGVTEAEYTSAADFHKLKECLPRTASSLKRRIQPQKNRPTSQFQELHRTKVSRSSGEGVIEV
jgi:hypothetical protein